LIGCCGRHEGNSCIIALRGGGDHTAGANCRCHAPKSKKKTNVRLPNKLNMSETEHDLGTALRSSHLSPPVPRLLVRMPWPEYPLHPVLCATACVATQTCMYMDGAHAHHSYPCLHAPTHASLGIRTNESTARLAFMFSWTRACFHACIPLARTLTQSLTTSA